MKILLINDLLVGGGAEVYTNNLRKILESDGHDVKFLYFSDKKSINQKYIGYNEKDIAIYVKKTHFLNKILINPRIYYLINNLIKSFNPDRVILNNIYTAPITILEVIKKIETYQIVHDYSIVCCNGDCIKKDKSICLGYKYGNCAEECNHFGNKMKMMIKQYNHKRVEKIRKKNIRLLVSPSKKLNEYLLDYGYNSICLNNPLEMYSVDKIKSKDNIKTYLYIGVINERKGIFDFIEAFNEFSSDKEARLVIIGKVEDNCIDIFNKLIKNNSKIEYKGYLKNDEVRKILAKSFCLVVPSVWMENYPTVVLEGMAAKTLVIGSNRGGIPEMLEHCKMLMFDVLNKNNIIDVLNYTFNIEEKDYSRIVNDGKKYLMKNNSYELYKKKVRKIFHTE